MDDKTSGILKVDGHLSAKTFPYALYHKNRAIRALSRAHTNIVQHAIQKDDICLRKCPFITFHT